MAAEGEKEKMEVDVAVEEKDDREEDVEAPKASKAKETAAAFFDAEASESEDEEGEGEAGKEGKKSRKGKDKGKDKEEGLDEYERDGFIVNESDEDEEELKMPSAKKKSKTQKGQGEDSAAAPTGDEDDEEEEEDSDSDAKDGDADDVLEEEDYEIAGKARKRKRRLKKMASGSDKKGASGFNPTDFNPENEGKAMTEEELKAKLFGNADLEDLEDADEEDPEEKEKRKEAAMEPEDDDFDSGTDVEDEFGDFIDDTEVVKERVVTDDMDDEQRRVAIEKEEERLKQQRRLAKKRQKSRASKLNISSQALREASELFQDADEMVKKYEEDKALRMQQGGGAGAQAGTGLSQRDSEMKIELEKKIDPAILQQRFFSNEDDAIRELDLPERLQLANMHSLEVSVKDMQDQGEWIYSNLLGQSNLNQENLFRRILEMGIAEKDSPGSLLEKHQLLGRRILEREKQSFDELWFEDQEQQERENAKQKRQIEALKKAINDVIGDIHAKGLEVPFIGKYRKDHCGPLLCFRKEDCPQELDQRAHYDLYERGFSFPDKGVLSGRIRRWDLLWKVHSLSSEWCSNYKRAQKRLESYKMLQIQGQEAGRDDIVEGIQRCIQLLESKNFGPQAIDDADAKFEIYLSLMQTVLQDSSTATKRPGRTDQGKLLSWRKIVPEALSKCMCITPEQFAENCEAQTQIHKPQAQTLDPLKFVEELQNTDVGSENILEKAILLLGKELASEPFMRQTIRMEYRAQAVISTKPKGSNSEIRDPLNMFCPVSCLDERPLHDFKEAECLYLFAAEKQGLITVEMKVPPEAVDETVKALSPLYFSGSESSSDREWDLYRKKILQDAVYNHLLPMAKLEAKNAMIVEAKMWLHQQMSDELWNRFSVAPWKPEIKDEDGEGMDKYVMACVWGSAKDKSQGSPTTLAMLDTEGALVDFLEVPSFSGKLGWSDNCQNILKDVRSKAAAADITRFIILHKPQVIALGSGTVECAKLKNVLEIIVGDVLVNHAQDMKGAVEGGDIHVILASQDTPRLWSTSSAASSEFSNMSENVKEAVALARMFLDPLPLVSSLFSQQKEVAGLNLHEAQQFLTAEEQIKPLEQCMMTIINQVGVDINDTVRQTWKSYSLPFVAGLGARKAPVLIDGMKRKGGYVQSRDKLSDLLGPKVWQNACAMFKFNREKISQEEDAELLDSTRIHPESYKAAKKLCSAIATSSDEASKALEFVMSNTESVDSFALKGFADDASNKVSLESVIDFTFELKEPFSELRDAWTKPGPEEEFDLVTSDVKDMIKPGRICNAMTMYSKGLSYDRMELRDLCIVELDCGLLANLETHDRLGRNMSVPVRILDVKPSKRILFFSSMNSTKTKEIEVYGIYVGNSEKDLSDNRRWEDKYCRSDFYSHITEEELRTNEVRPQAQKLIFRPIQHHFYKNLGFQKINKMLETETVEGADGKKMLRYGSGSYFFRPSTKGLGTLAVTLKISSDPFIVLHEQIIEENRDPNTLTLGLPLRLKKYGNEQYDDLDEIIARFIDPLMANVEEAKKHKKFVKAKSKEDVEKHLHGKMAKYDVTATAISLSVKYPGYLLLSYLFKKGSRPRHEFIKILPDGFTFRNKQFERVDKVYTYFKTNPMKKPGESDPYTDGRDRRYDSYPQQQQQHYGGSSQGYGSQDAYQQPYNSSQGYGNSGGYGNTGGYDNNAGYGYDQYNNQGYGYT